MSNNRSVPQGYNFVTSAQQLRGTGIHNQQPQPQYQQHTQFAYPGQQQQQQQPNVAFAGGSYYQQQIAAYQFYQQQHQQRLMMQQQQQPPHQQQFQRQQLQPQPQQQQSSFCMGQMPSPPIQWKKIENTISSKQILTNPSSASVIEEKVIDGKLLSETNSSSSNKPSKLSASALNTTTPLEIRGKIFRKCHITNVTLINCTLEEGCLLASCALAGCTASRVPLFISCSMDSCSVTLSDMTYCFVRKLLISNCRLLDCKMNACNVSNSQALRTAFTDCITGKMIENECDHLAQGNALVLCQDAGAPVKNKMVVSNSKDFGRAERELSESGSSNNAAAAMIARSYSSSTTIAGGALQDNEHVDAVRKRLEKFYQKHQPTQIENIPVILRVYKGRESDLWKQLRAKYFGPDDTFDEFNDENDEENIKKQEEQEEEKKEDNGGDMSPTNDMTQKATQFQNELDRVEKIKHQMTLIYQKHHPEKIDNVEKILLKYRGHEDSVFAALKIKYKVSQEEMDKLIADAKEAKQKEEASSNPKVEEGQKPQSNDTSNKTAVDSSSLNNSAAQIAPAPAPPPLLLHINNPTDSEREQLRLRCSRIIRKYIPERNEQDLLKKYVGKEEFLLPALVKKYCPDGVEPPLSEEEATATSSTYDNIVEQESTNSNNNTDGSKKDQKEKQEETNNNTESKTPVASSNVSSVSDLGSLDDLNLDDEDIHAIPSAPQTASTTPRKALSKNAKGNRTPGKRTTSNLSSSTRTNPTTPKKVVVQATSSNANNNKANDDDDISDLGSLDLDLDDMDDDDDLLGSDDSLGDLDLSDDDLQETFSMTV